MHSTSGAYGKIQCTPYTAHVSNSQERLRTGQPPITTLIKSRDDSNCLAMLPELTKLKVTAVHCEHLSTHLVTGDGRQDALVRPGYKLSATISNISNVVYTQLIVKCKIVLYGGRSWKQLCSHSGCVTWWLWQPYTVLLNAGQLNQLKCSHTTTII